MYHYLKVIAVTLSLSFSIPCFADSSSNLEDFFLKTKRDWEACDIDEWKSKRTEDAMLFGFSENGKFGGKGHDIIYPLMNYSCQNGKNVVEIGEYSIQGDVIIFKWSNTLTGNKGADIMFVENGKVTTQAFVVFTANDFK